ncbi:MAG: hypothetical protein MK111_20240 [Crocosphaera sp.]|uniref:DNA topoisomerase type IA domain-containing protein n=3 Tax=Crocosphaera watsonii TaxID=263511 RepID=G5JB06_CROWT|nr:MULTISPECIES: hypothetical protein [Crocosphaera]EHJ10629.1 hypothetical protein CWATWH0003_4618 [Crocosphaera watsonii WH 0003]MCH2246927.1 hypothetical protein [Crocosphaera sp.]CCQ54583.1 hypothetical protein CWATWH0005_473 [Crocosphaera watsonii WH 0005]
MTIKNNSSKPTRQIPRPILKKKTQDGVTRNFKAENLSNVNCQWQPQFDVNLIIAEKPRISGAIARALLHSGNIEDYLHSDIIIINKSKKQSEEKRKKLPIYLQQTADSRFSFESLHLDYQGKTHAEKVRRRIRTDETFRNKIIEEISYYIIPYENKIFIIGDTQGNPFTYSLPKNQGLFHKNLLNLIDINEDWLSLSKNLSLKASFKKNKRTSPNDPKLYSDESESYVARTLWFEYVLAWKKLPCKYKQYTKGTCFNIEKVIASTDEDIAGSYIFLSVIDLANQVSSRNKLSQIPPKKIKRLDMMSLEAKELRKSLSNLREFDWDMAFAGKNRADFDFIFGTTMTTWFKSLWRDNIKKNKSEYIPISIGRNRCLGLKELINLEIEAENRVINREIKDYLYVVFPGLIGWSEIVEYMRQGNYLSLHLEMIECNVTPATLLLKCQELGIGTHTTRYKISSQLKALGLADYDQQRLLSTTYGQSYNYLLDEYLNPKLNSESNIGLSKWSKNLHDRITEAKKINLEKLIDLPSAKRNYTDFMNNFFPSFQEYIKILEKRKVDISQALEQLRDLYYEYEMSTQAESSHQIENTVISPNNFHEPEYNSNSIMLQGYESCISEQAVRDLFEGTSKHSTIKRIIPPVSIDVEGIIRRICVIPQEFSFGVKQVYNESLLLNLEKQQCTVFRANLAEIIQHSEIPLSEEQGLLIKSLKNYISMNLEQINEIKENTKSPHQPLMMNSISRSDISGPLGLKLVQEYNNPWVATFTKIKRHREGGINVESFEADQLQFQRVEQYLTGKVHNFESLLVTMFNKYGVPFQKTANMAQDLYLNVD